MSNDDALAILASAKTRIYRYFLSVELRSVQEDLFWRRTLSRTDKSERKIYSGIYRDEELMPKKKKEATWWTPSKRCCLKRLGLPPTPVYFLEDSRRFYQLLSPVLPLLSFTVMRLHAAGHVPQKEERCSTALAELVCRILECYYGKDSVRTFTTASTCHRFHRRAEAKTSLEDDDVPIDDTTTKTLFTPQEKGRKGLDILICTFFFQDWRKDRNVSCASSHTCKRRSRT
ncbi:hypothetical protein LAZ67_X004667 [Cordylochernes scorpioides]|uniref:Uncharacterized protein n=1 Tax=Cordylochernes scorpioides TaxID=51811 RepID=A0ABY6LZ94_9ARAC|nr:hypothetical protein LAZ67_X004667 [Cordylochernes scorpioides]